MGCSHPVHALTPWSHMLSPGPGGCWGAAVFHSGLWAPSSGGGVGWGPDAFIIQSWVLAVVAEDWMHLAP